MYPEPIPSMHSYTPAGAGLGLAHDLKYVICDDDGTRDPACMQSVESISIQHIVLLYISFSSSYSGCILGLGPLQKQIAYLKDGYTT